MPRMPRILLAAQISFDRYLDYRDRWVNRMILGDSLVVMNSLLRFENLGGQVQMIVSESGEERRHRWGTGIVQEPAHAGNRSP
jgi:hypothetical protein